MVAAAGGAYACQVTEWIWYLASLIDGVDKVRRNSVFPNQLFGLEIVISISSNVLLLTYSGYQGSTGYSLDAGTFTFPRYEIDQRDRFDELLTLFDRDLWNLAAFDPDWALSVNWQIG